ncbi:hypothetical protein TARUN_2783 [Trichoderma arundinaceum]|uniref:Uncharacterized protein n=1 Tax=Trichoderma arundinaceum TaxID=490622 RepID=A0A395NTM2_TRIAR|nr:hypothetical protein TARUN_2783 [Trichoderma arundinaceum]
MDKVVASAPPQSGSQQSVSRLSGKQHAQWSVTHSLRRWADDGPGQTRVYAGQPAETQCARHVRARGGGAAQHGAVPVETPGRLWALLKEGNGTVRMADGVGGSTDSTERTGRVRLSHARL